MGAGEGGAVRPLPADELEHVVRLVLGPLVPADLHPHPPLPQRAREDPLPAHGDEDGAAVQRDGALHPHAVVLPQHCARADQGGVLAPHPPRLRAAVAEEIDAPPQLQVAGGRSSR
eukprot:gene12494-biopygen8154